MPSRSKPASRCAGPADPTQLVLFPGMLPADDSSVGAGADATPAASSSSSAFAEDDVVPRDVTGMTRDGEPSLSGAPTRPRGRLSGATVAPPPASPAGSVNDEVVQRMPPERAVRAIAVSVGASPLPAPRTATNPAEPQASASTPTHHARAAGVTVASTTASPKTKRPRPTGGVLRAMRESLPPVVRPLLVRDGARVDHLPIPCDRWGLRRPGRQSEPIEQGVRAITGPRTERSRKARDQAEAELTLLDALWHDLPVEAPPGHTEPPEAWRVGVTHLHLDARWLTLTAYAQLARELLPHVADPSRWWLTLQPTDRTARTMHGAIRFPADRAIPVSALTVEKTVVGLCAWEHGLSIPRVVLTTSACDWRTAVVRLNGGLVGPVVGLGGDGEWLEWVRAPRALPAIWSPWSPLRDAVFRREVRRWSDRALWWGAQGRTLDEALTACWTLTADGVCSADRWEQATMRGGDITDWRRRTWSARRGQ